MAGVLGAAVLLAVISIGMVTDRGRLERCATIAGQVETFISERSTTKASELLGQGKTQLAQLTFARWFHSERYNDVAESLSQSSQRVSSLEAQRFSSLFGEISLREVHQQRPGDLTDLIADGLRAYGVMRTADWQHQSPFVDLSSEQQEVVAEGISELMLVSMQHSSNKAKPTRQQVGRVLDRLPRQHRDFTLFKNIAETQEVSAQPYDADTASHPFEAYLYGVLASIQREHRDASHFYSQSLRDNKSKRERFWCHYRYAHACQELKCNDEAFIHYGICLGLQPDFAWPKFNMGLACLDNGNPDLAMTYIHQAIKDDPKFTAAYATLIAIQTQKGDNSDAIATYEIATSNGLSSPELTTNYNIAKSRVKAD